MTDFDEMSATFRLCAIPSFMEGMAMALDSAYTMPEFNTSANPADADVKALAADWEAVAGDLANAMHLQNVR